MTGPTGLVRLVERALGGEIPARLRPLLVMTLAAVVGQWMLTAYLPIYVVTRVGITAQTAGVLLAVATATGLVVGPLGGRVADRRGPVPVLVVSLALQVTCALVLLTVPGLIGATAAAAALAVGFTLRTTIQNTLVADLAEPEKREAAFALLRTAVNLSAAAGPAAGAVLLLAGWPALWAGSLVASLAALRQVQRLSVSRIEGDTGSTVTPCASPLTSPGKAARLLPGMVGVAVVANALAWTVYNAFEVLLPVAIVSSYHLPPSLWGLVFLLNPVGVVLLQVRLIAWTARLTRATRLLLATGLMSASFLLLLASHHVAVLAVAVAVFTLGEILWGPTSQALVVSLTPTQQRGAAMGFLSASATAGAVIASAAGLPLLAQGPILAWTVVAVIGIISGQLFLAASRAATSRPNQVGNQRQGRCADELGQPCTRTRTSTG